MTVIERTAEPSADDVAQALFEEARRRRKRRRVLTMATVVLVATAGLVVSETGGNGSGGHHKVAGHGHSGGTSGDRSSAGGHATTVSLPTRYSFNSVTTSGRNLLLTGTVASESPSAQCVAARMNPQTLKIGKVIMGSCNDPALAGLTVTPVSSRSQSGPSTVAVAKEDPSTGAVTTGPVIISYSYASDTQPVTAYGAGSMWTYDVATTNGPEVLQVSEATGGVTDTVRVPTLYRPVMAANDDGLWFGNSVQGGSASSPLWHVAPGAHSAVAVPGLPASQQFDKPGVGLRNYPLDVIWLVGEGHHLWAGISLAGNIDQTIWRFDGPTGVITFHVPDRGYDPTGVVGDASDGLWAAVPYPPINGRVTRSRSGTWTTPGQNIRQDVVQIDPTTGTEIVESAIQPAPTLTAEVGVVHGQATAVDGSFFILQQPLSGSNDRYSVLVRVRP
jgi:hypothetical protein